MPSGTNGTGWPLVGRTEELELLRMIRSSRPASSAVIGGPAGVGKSRLARAALEEAATEGWATLTIRGSAGYAAVPLGPLRTVLRIPGSDSLADLTSSVERELLALRAGKGLLVLADDCQSLDDASAGLLHQLAGGDDFVTIVTARSDSRLPAALVDLWKDDLAERIELQNLSLRETNELLSVGLGGPLSDSTANRIWQVTGGNPLYLREVVLSGRESDALRVVDGEWRWQGEWAAGARLQEIVAARLGSLDPDETTVMEMLALAGSLPLGLVSGLTSTRAVEGLEARELVSTDLNGERIEVTIAHPLHAEVLRSRMPSLQQRALRRNLVDALAATGSRRSEDLVRLACWSLESGLDVDPVTLSLGTDASLFAISDLLSARLHEVLPEQYPTPPSSGPAVRQDFKLAARLAQAAYDRSGGIVEGAALASALGWLGEVARAGAVLDELAHRASAPDDRLRLALVIGWIRFWCQYEADGAVAVLEEAIESVGEAADPVLVGEVYEELAGIALNTANPTLALAHARRAAEVTGVDLSESSAASPAAASLAYLGRCGEAIALVDRAVPNADRLGHPLAVATLLFTRAGALSRKGELEAAHQLLTWLRDVALSGEMLDATATFGVLLGEILLRQGRPASAGRIFADASGLLAERDVLGYRPWALAGLARARARSGNEEAAAWALEELRRIRTIDRHYDVAIYLAESAVHQLAGRTAAALEAARDGANWARGASMVGDQALALDTWLRLEPSPEPAERLAGLAAESDSELVAALAAHARAVIDRHPDGLLAAGERFAAMTAWWLAAEAAAGAARVLAQRHQDRAARAATLTASRWAEHCEGARTSVADTLRGPVRLTKREREIANLAAAGRSNREIAEGMCVSTRTVENHLHHAFVKLGVNDRARLSEALVGGAPVE
jgi:ATP/maltotriose-dependent transcriptional regulator MalT